MGLFLSTFPRLYGGTPLVGPCSAAITAACASNQGDPDASPAMLMCCVISENGVDGSASRSVGFSAGPVSEPQNGVEYR